MRDENQLHAAVVELVARKKSKIKYSTVQNWYPGDENGKGGILNKLRHQARRIAEEERRDARILLDPRSKPCSAITWKYPSCHSARRPSAGRVLFGGFEPTITAAPIPVPR